MKAPHNNFIKDLLFRFANWNSLTQFGVSDKWFSEAVKRPEFRNRPFLSFARYTNYHKLNRVISVVDYIEKWTESKGLKRNQVKILEIGCGNNPVHSLYLASLGYRVVGIDMYASEIAVAREKAIGLPDLEFITAEAADFLNQGDRQFDFILCLDVMQLMQNPEDVCQLISESLKSSGMLLLILSDGYSEIALIYIPLMNLVHKIILKAKAPPGWFQSQKFTLRRIKRMITSSDLEYQFVNGIYSSRVPFLFTFPFGFRGWLAYLNIKASRKMPPFMTNSWLVAGIKKPD